MKCVLIVNKIALSINYASDIALQSYKCPVHFMNRDYVIGTFIVPSPFS
jgi:hypothetical protein